MRRVIATAGGAASPLWRQIVADILDDAPRVSPAGQRRVGDHVLAGYASGLVGSFEAVRDDWLAGPKLTVPDVTTRHCYDDLYRLYCHLDGNLSAAFAMLPSTHV